jgi:hypothetical protein
MTTIKFSDLKQLLNLTNPFSMSNIITASGGVVGGATKSLSQAKTDAVTYVAATSGTSGFVQWATRISSTAEDRGLSVCSTTDGGILVAGYFGNTMTAYSSTTTAYLTNLTSLGANDAFIIKFNTAGIVQWLLRCGGTNSEQINAIDVTSDNGIVVGGYFISNPFKAYNIDGSQFATTLTPLTVTGGDAFLIKYNSSLNVEWLAKIGNIANTDDLRSLCVLNDGGIIAVGYYFGGTVSAFNANGTEFSTKLTNSGTYDIFTIKYTSSGSVAWVAKCNGSNDDQPTAVKSLSDGGFIVAGWYFASNPLTIYNSNITAFGTTLANSGSNDMFIIKYNTSGFVQWVTRLAGTGWDTLAYLSISSSGDIYIGGTIGSNTITAYNQNNTAFGTLIARIAGNDGVLVKYNSSGNVQWVSKQGGSLNDLGYSVTATSDGGAVITGYYLSNPLSAYNASGTIFGTSIINSGSNDIYIAKYTTSGVVEWITRIAGSAGDFPSHICTMSNGNIAIVGYYASNPLTFYNKDGTSFATTLPNIGNNDIFIVVYKP